jgi:hypothetical protein
MEVTVTVGWEFQKAGKGKARFASRQSEGFLETAQKPP